MRSSLPTVIPLAASNSLGFVRAMLQALDERQPFAIIREQSQKTAISGVHWLDEIEPPIHHGFYSNQHPLHYSDQLAQIAFTSGTTGAPKGIALSYTALSDTAQRLIDVQGLESSVSEYIAVPPTYSFGAGRVRACAAAGGKSFIPSGGFDAVEFARMLKAGEINALSVVPTLARLVLRYKDLYAECGDKMRWIEIGSQPMSVDEKKAFRSLFPNARIIQHYGLTEAARTTFLNISEATDAELVSVGRTTGNARVRINGAGIIEISGKHVASAIFGLTGNKSIVDANGWLTTNDVGKIEGGNLHFVGRDDDLINFGGIKISPDKVEDLIRQRISMSRVAACRVADDLRGDGIAVVSDDPAVSVESLREAALQALAALGVSAGGALEAIKVDRIPETDTGKTKRSQLARDIALRNSLIVDEEPGLSERSHNAGEQEILEAFRSAFPRRHISASDSFASLGGDSLAHVMITTALGDRLIPLPEEWECLPVRNINEHFRKHDSSGRVPKFGLFSPRDIGKDVVLRVGAVMLIVLHHTLHRHYLGGGIEALMLLIGYNLSRFQVGQFTSSERWNNLYRSFAKLLIAYFIVVAGLDLLTNEEIGLTDYFLVSNFFGQFKGAIVIYWFVAAYVQTLSVFTVILAIPSISRYVALQPAKAGIIGLALAVAVKVISLLTFNHSYLLGRTPDQFLYIIFLGWTVQRAKRPLAKVAVFALACIMGYLSFIQPNWWTGFDGTMHGPILVLAVAVLLWLPSVRMPNVFRYVCVEIALASLMIYVAHPLVLKAFEHSLPYVVKVVLAVLSGIMLRRALDFAPLLWRGRSLSTATA